MRLDKKRLVIFFLLLLSGCYYSGTALAQNSDNGYGTRPYAPPDNQVGEFPHYTDAGYSLSSLVQQAPGIKIAAVLLGVVGALALFKMFPFILGRLKHALENPKTRDIFFFIQRNPGVTISELSEEQKINRGTLKYHLSQLLSNNKIIFVRKGKFSRLFYNTSSTMDMESIISRYMKNENSSKILFKIMESPGISNQELSDWFNLAKSTTHDYLENFFDDGLVEFRQDGKFKRCYMKQDARMIMLRYKPDKPLSSNFSQASG